MIGKHLWECGGGRNWRAGEERKCAKCQATVKFVTQPRKGSRVFCWMDRQGQVHPVGPMPKCEP